MSKVRIIEDHAAREADAENRLVVEIFVSHKKKRIINKTMLNHASGGAIDILIIISISMGGGDVEEGAVEWT